MSLQKGVAAFPATETVLTSVYHRMNGFAFKKVGAALRILYQMSIFDIDRGRRSDAPVQQPDRSQKVPHKAAEAKEEIEN